MNINNARKKGSTLLQSLILEPFSDLEKMLQEGAGIYLFTGK
jgi:hypothetical protein